MGFEQVVMQIACDQRHCYSSDEVFLGEYGDGVIRLDSLVDDWMSNNDWEMDEDGGIWCEDCLKAKDETEARFKAAVIEQIERVLHAPKIAPHLLIQNPNLNYVGSFPIDGFTDAMLNNFATEIFECAEIEGAFEDYRYNEGLPETEGDIIEIIRIAGFWIEKVTCDHDVSLDISCMICFVEGKYDSMKQAA